MSSTHTITLLKPDGTGSFTGKPNTLNCKLQTEDFGELVIDYNVSYSTLTNAYENGKVTYVRNAGSNQTLFVGKIIKVERGQDGGRQTIRVQCADLKASLDGTVAGADGSNLITVETEQIALANYGLTRDGIPATDDGFLRYFPDADTNSAPDNTSPWVAITSTDYAPLADFDGNVTDSATELLTDSTVDQGFPPRGILWTSASNYTTNVEFIWYDGYAPDPGNSDKYKFYNCVRGALGSTPSIKNSSYVIGLRQVKPLNLDVELTVEAYDGSNWQQLERGAWRPNNELGCFDFYGDLTASPYSYTDFRYSASHFDVDAAGAVTLESLTQKIMEYAKANGGPGLTVTTDFTIDWPRVWILDDVGNGRVRHTRPFIDSLIAQYEPYTWVGRGLGYWFNPTNSKWEFKTYLQAGTADLDLSAIKPRRITEKYNTADAYSAVLVPFKPVGASLNLLSVDRSWHPAKGTSGHGSNAVTVTALLYQYAEAANAAGWNRDTASSSTVQYNELVLNGNPTTGAGLEFEDNPGTSLYAFDFWFPNVDTYEVGTVSFCVDFRSFLPPGTQCGVYLYGWEEYTPHATSPTRTGPKLLGSLLVQNGNLAPAAGSGSYALNVPDGWPGGIV